MSKLNPLLKMGGALRNPFKGLLGRSSRQIAIYPEDLQGLGRTRVYLCGDLALHSLDSQWDGQDRQYSRLPPLVLGSGKRLFAVVNKAALASKARVTLGVDDLAWWGERLNRPAIILTGAHYADRTLIVALVFRQKELMHIEERSLGSLDDKRFWPDLDALIDSLTGMQAGATLMVAAPLDPMLAKRKSISWMGDEAYQGKTQRLIAKQREELFNPSRYMAAVLVAVVGAAAIFLINVKDQQNLASAVAQFEQEAREVGGAAVAGKQSFSQEDVQLMQKRREILAEAKRHAIVGQVDEILRAIGQSNSAVEVSQFAVFVNPTGPNAAQVRIKVRLEKSKGSAVDQIRPIIETASAQSGIPLRLTLHSEEIVPNPTDAANPLKVWRYFTLEGGNPA